jgi:predicted DNA-binding transcriptional regulator YafY
MLKRLPRHESGSSTQEICEALSGVGYDVDDRTVQRDLQRLSEVFGITFQPGRPNRWSWRGASELSVTGVSITDALTISLLERFIKPLLPKAITSRLTPVFEAASTRLQQERGNALARWSELVEVTSTTLQFVPPVVSADVLQCVQDALFAGEKIQVNYVTSAGKRRQKWTLSPLGLVQAGTITYLVCRPEPIGSSEILRLPLHRIRAAVRSFEPAVKPPNFRLKNFVQDAGMEFGAGLSTLLQLRLSPELAQQLAATKLSTDQRLEPEMDGDHVRLTATVRDTWRLRWWLLSKTGDIEVVAPESLRQEIASKLRAAAALYAPLIHH